MTQPKPQKSQVNSQTGSAAELFRQGHQAEQEGSFERARCSYEMALQQSPDQHPWLYRLGCTHLKLAEPNLAEVVFRRALEMEPANEAYLTNLAVALDRQGLRNEAVRAYRKSIQLGGKSPVPHHNLGSIYAEEGRTEDAIRSFEAAIALEPDAQGYHSLGLVHFGAGDLTRALVCFERSTSCDASFSLGHYFAALCLMKTGIYDSAISRFHQAIAPDSRLARVPLHIGVCLHKLEKYHQAKDSLENALGSFPEDGKVHYQLALTCDALGCPQEARQHYSLARAARNQNPPC